MLISDKFYGSVMVAGGLLSVVEGFYDFLDSSSHAKFGVDVQQKWLDRVGFLGSDCVQFGLK